MWYYKSHNLCENLTIDSEGEGIEKFRKFAIEKSEPLVRILGDELPSTLAKDSNIYASE